MSREEEQFHVYRYPVKWRGHLALKSCQVDVEMRYLSGNDSIAMESLPQNIDYLRIFQRMGLRPLLLEPVERKLQILEEHCVLIVLPWGEDRMDVLRQSNNLKTGFIDYLEHKTAVGVINSGMPGSNQPSFSLHIFPPCEFTNTHIRIPEELQEDNDPYLIIVITTV